MKNETKKKVVWVTVNSTALRFKYQCEHCNNEEIATLESINEGGPPYCADCESDMVFVKVQMKKAA